MSEDLGAGLSAVEIVPIHVLLPAGSPRSAGGDVRRVRLPSERGGTPLPVILHRPTMRVVDGMHRLRAATLRGEETVRVRFLEDGAEDVFAVAANEGGQPAARPGRDGRIRPPDGSDGRVRAAEPAVEETCSPLRRITRQPGISPGTVRDARDRPRRGEVSLSRSLPSASLPPD
ncbi:hypothetical protein [Streptosporangium sp. NPDC002524]|uniref:hypothetical protein n=1 Tax=Streptosporangium sp. NPDC002524 TaxID=3154537 RepID=UPI0033244AE3